VYKEHTRFKFTRNIFCSSFWFKFKSANRTWMPNRISRFIINSYVNQPIGPAVTYLLKIMANWDKQVVIDRLFLSLLLFLRLLNQFLYLVSPFIVNNFIVCLNERLQGFTLEFIIGWVVKNDRSEKFVIDCRCYWNWTLQTHLDNKW